MITFGHVETPIIIIGAVMTLSTVLSTVPVIVRAQLRGRVESFALGHAATGIPVDMGDGLRRISLGIGEIGAGAIAADLRYETVDVKIDADTGGSFGGINANYTLLYRTVDESKVLAAVAKQLK